MAKSNVAAEPSMEEILASIRRIIADEEPVQESAKRGDFNAGPADEEDGYSNPTSSGEDVLDLGAEEDNSADHIPAQTITPIDTDDISFDALEQQQPVAPVAQRPRNDWSEANNRPAPQARAPQQQFAPPPPQQSAYQPQQAYQPSQQQNYQSPSSGGIISAHTDTAVSAAFNSLASAIFSSEPRTIEDLTKDMLKPLLKQWLDDNLPSLVERIVRDEIERVARGRK